ncbi:MAG: hypothetical protein O7D91_17575 [Planctomycetota bacterium]|nr:hypothetical protein [Planctomycetota bacterium]
MRIEDRRTGKKREIGALEGGQVFDDGVNLGLWLLAEDSRWATYLESGRHEVFSEGTMVWPVSGKFVIEDGPR